jgi:hypothetical protein
MFNIALILFVATELSFYLLIAQTGIVESFGSNIEAIIYLPIGGIIGSILSSYIKFNNRYKMYFLLLLQLSMSYIYPNLNPLNLAILGFAVGGIAPLVIHTLKSATKLDLIISLSLSYIIGTYLFNSTPYDRGSLAITLTLITLFSSLFLGNKENLYKGVLNHSLYIMMLWVFLDSALFETLSRDSHISIWRDGYSFEIALFHTIGVLWAFIFKGIQKEIFITVLFAISYLLYFMNESLLLAIVYPFVISYYNITILQNLVCIKSLRKLGIYMLFIGWVASGLGLFIALNSLISIVPILFLVVIIKNIFEQLKFTKEVYYG